MAYNKSANDRIDNLDNTYFNTLRDKYVPASGAADTEAGEIIRAMDRLIYRFWNDGDKVGFGYGNETCNSSYRYLYRKIGTLCPSLACVDDDYRYFDLLADTAENVKTYLTNHPESFNTPNTEDSRIASPEDYDYYDDEDEDDEYDEDEYDY